jgi:hypothetical protein
MPHDHREDFEHRFLAALRTSLDSCDSAYGDRYSVARFAVHYEALIEFPDGEVVPVWMHTLQDDSVLRVFPSDTGFWAAEDELWNVLERESLDDAWAAVQEMEESETARRQDNKLAGEGEESEGPFDVVGWVGPLVSKADRRRLEPRAKRWRKEVKRLRKLTDSGPFPLRERAVSSSFRSRFDHDVLYFQDADPETMQSRLVELGAQATCRVIGGGYDYGAKVPLREALEIATGPWAGQDLILLCVPGRLAYWQDHHDQRVIVFRQD